MARISQYDQDGTLNKLDKVVGTDSATGATKNYTIDSMIGLVNSEDLVNVFDGVSYAFKSYEAGSTNPRGIINLNAGAAANSPFSGISQIYISVLDKHGNSIANYLDDTLNSFIRIVQKTNIDTYGVLEVTAVADHDGGAYKLLTVTPRVNNGNIVANEEYFVSNYSAVFDQDFSDDSVTEFSDVTSAGSGEIITTAERQSLNNFTANGLLHADVVDNVTSTAADVPLSANQGKVLKDLIDSINTLLTSDNVDLDSLQEVVDYIEANRDTLDNLGISNISGLQAALDAKQNTEVGKGLSTEDFTTALLTKLNGIAASAEVNVQSNWSEANTGSDAFIQNKPSDLTNLTIHSVTELNDVTSAGSGAVITSAERTKLGGIEDSADVTDTANVTAAGALMDSEVTNLAQVKAFDTADYATAAQGAKADSAQQPPVEGPFVDGDKTKLDGIEPNADVTDTANVTAAGALMDSELTDEAAVKAIDQGLATTDDVDFNSIQVDDTIELITAQSTTPTFDNGIYYTTENGHDTLHFRYHGHDLSIDYLTENIPTGILNGGVLSTNTSTTFDVAAGDGVINILNKDNSDPHPEIKKVAWSATTVTHTLGNAGDANQLNTWVYVDSSGNIQQTLTIPSPALWRSNIVLGSVIHSSNIIRFVKTFPRPSYSNGNTFAEFVEIFGPLKKSGHLLTVNSTNTLALDRAAGISFGVGRNYQVDAEEPNLVSDGASTPAFHRYSSTATGFTKDDGTAGAGYTSIDPTKYDNSGTLTTASAGQYTAQRLFHFPNNTNVIVAYYGKAEYSSIDDAEKNYLLEDFQEADNTSSQAIYLGVLIVKGNATDLGNSSQAKILTGGIFRSLSATNLGGVAADAAINDLTDVNITGVANDEILQYNSSTGNWENSSLNSDQVTQGSTNLYYPSADATKVGHISVTQAVDLDTIESDTATNNAKVTFPGFGTVAGTALEGDTQFVDGTGTAGALPKFNDSDTLADSVISESGQVLDINVNGAIKMPDGTTSERPSSPAAGMFRYNTTDGQFEGYTTEWGAIAGSGGGSGEIVKETFSGTGSQATFTLSDTIGNIDNISVYVSGVYQYPSNYTVSGANVIFAAGSIPALGTNNVHVVHTTTVASITEVGSVFVDQFTGNGSDTQFSPLGAVPSSENHTDVYIDGVYQQKNAYSIAGSQITFTDAPDTGAYVEVKTTGTIAPAAVNAVATNLVSDSFTATADQTSFALTNGTPSAKELTMVFVQGVYQAKVNYSLLTSPTRIVLTEGAEVGETVEVISVSGANLTTSPVVSVNGQTGAVTFDTYTAPTVYVINTNTTAVANSVYVLTANLTLTLPTSPSSGDSIKISNRSGVATCVLARNGSNIMGSASDLTLDTASASFELIYSDATNGWVIIGQ